MTLVDLHSHSTASDGDCDPAELVARAAVAGLSVLGLTDHDTLAGIPDAAQACESQGLRLVRGCEFSVSVWWGEMHLLGYFLPLGDRALDAFLFEQRQRREKRGATIVHRLNAHGVQIGLDDVMRQANGAAVGRPHVARALVAAGTVPDVQTAFDRYIGGGCPAFVAKDLPAVSEVTSLVAQVGGLTSAAHLGRRASRAALGRLKDSGVDGVEVRHPSHDEDTTAKIERLATALGMLMTGGSDWHGDHGGPYRALGDVTIPADWLERLDDVANIRARERKG